MNAAWRALGEEHAEQAIQAAQERQQAWEHNIEQDHENNRGFEIE